MCSSSSLSKFIHQTIKGAQRLGYDNYASDHSESLLALSSETIMRGHCAIRSKRCKMEAAVLYVLELSMPSGVAILEQ